MDTPHKNEVDEYLGENLSQTPSIKIIKNTKGYNFEFKILSLDTALLDDIHKKIMENISKWEKEYAK